MQKYYHIIDIPVTDFIMNKDMIPNKPKDVDVFVTGCDPKLYLHNNIYKKLSELGELYSLVFGMSPGAAKNSIHIDIDSNTQEPFWPSLNILIDGQGSMRWFSPNSPGKLLKNTNANAFYKAWFDDYGEPLDEWNTGKIALVRTDTPHQVWNFDTIDRRVVSIRWQKKYTWQETIDWFQRNFPSN
jgi:hypothetical protein